MPRTRSFSKNTSTANLGLEAKLRLASDTMRNWSSQDKRVRGKRGFGLANRARRVRLIGDQPKQSNATTCRLAVMQLALRGIQADFGPEHADTFRRDFHPDFRADYVYDIEGCDPRQGSATDACAGRSLPNQPASGPDDSKQR
jgi:hypothetical protein